MPVALRKLESELSNLLKPELFSDYCPNGLQLEGRTEVRKLVTGVTACQALIDAAIDEKADVVLVHHGYFWRGEDQSITGLKKNRLQALMKHDISLFAYHLPLDAHPELGNNAQLAKVLGLRVEGSLDQRSNTPIVFSGSLKQPASFAGFKKLLEEQLQRVPLAIEGRAKKIKSIAWCTGAAQSYIELAVAAGVDAYLTGEISEPTVHIARESGIHFFSAGHHATERYGVQAVGNYLAEKFSIQHQFIDIDNPA
ncbi:MAG: Nif3-like dinuclear metal center hexameric protein [Proteobacteria bacterium]|nr:Nif3-like dinuclear metal center hexameric protein [Pseudomonadota bacterium]